MTQNKTCRDCAHAQLNYRDRRKKSFCKVVRISIGPQTSARYCPDYMPKYGRTEDEGFFR